MGVERQNISEKTFGSLGGCLVEGGPEQRSRERGVRRRAIAMSITLQGAALAALVLVPLFGKPERIVLANVTPVPPYYHPSGPVHHDTPNAPSRPTTTFTFCLTCPLPSPHLHVPTSTQDRLQPSGEVFSGEGSNSNSFCPGCIPMPGREGPTPPQTESQPKRLKMTQLDPALLIHRVEPVYPPLPRVEVAAWNCAPSLRPMDQSSPCKLSLEIRFSFSRHWTPCSSGATDRPY